MAALKKWLIFALFLVLLIPISGCKGKKDAKKPLEEIRAGTEGIVISFLPNAPPDKIHVEEGATNDFDVILSLRNKGAYPHAGEVSELGPNGKLFLSGYDPQIITFESKDGKFGDLSKMLLEGKSTINPNGGQDILSFTGTINVESLNVEKYEPTLLATACYYYETIAGPSVCIDPDPYSAAKGKKVCEVQGTTLNSQGAPIAVTKIDEEAFAKKTQFKIAIKNVGGGDVLKDDALGKCNPLGNEKIGMEDINKVKVEEVSIGNNQLQCSPFADTASGSTGLVKLINGEGYVICELSEDLYGESSSAFITPLKVRLAYVYRNTAEKKVQILKETGAN